MHGREFPSNIVLEIWSGHASAMRTIPTNSFWPFGSGCQILQPHFLSARLPTFFCYPCATTFSATISNSTKIFENLSCWIYETERHDLRDLSERPWEASVFAVAAVGPRCAVPTVEAMNFSLGSPQRLRRRTYGLISTNGAFAQQYLC
jgi:hypothetical protein